MYDRKDISVTDGVVYSSEILTQNDTRTQAPTCSERNAN